MKPIEEKQWLLSEMSALATIEPDLHPDDYLINGYDIYDIKWHFYKGAAYKLLRERLSARLNGRSITHLIIVPWLVTGGADKAAILFANIVAENPSYTVVVLATELRESTWANRLNSNVIFFDLGRFFDFPDKNIHRIDISDQREILAHFILENEIKVVHVINSHLGWITFGKYSHVLSSKSNLYVSLYCYDFTNDNEPVGYARLVRGIAHNLTGIFSDNTKFPDYLTRIFGINSKLFTTTWHPVSLEEQPSLTTSLKTSNILWASRLDRQKRPDILLAIAKKMPNFNFHVYGDSVMDSCDYIEFIESISHLSNVFIHGAYSNIKEVKRRGYLCFLYTSEWDGLPNILLEIGSLGLPIITADQGGISDLIDNDTGYLVSNVNQVDEYCDRITNLSNNRLDGLRKAIKCKKRIEQRHSIDSFINCLQSARNYL